MKRLAMAALAVSLGLAWTEATWAQSATRDECVAKTQEASQLIKEKGLEAAVAEINKKEGKYVWKDSYVFLMDLDGKMLAHPMSPALVGKNVLETKDKGEPGKLLFREFVDVAKTKGEGWVDYMWPKPGAQIASKKVSFIYRVPGKDVLVAAGLYE